MLLKCSNLTMNYGTKVALNNINLELDKGYVIGLVGPNGSGKTTLIKIINGLLTPKSGKVLVNGRKVGVSSKKVISYLPERTYLDPSQRVSDIFAYFIDFYKDFDLLKAKKLLTELGISENAKIKELSKGMKEKVQLVLVMSRKADLYILDEPIAGVDPASRDYIIETIINNKSSDSTVIISTHLIAEIESILDKVIILKEGNLLYDGKTSILIKDYSSLDEWFRKEFRHVKTS